MSAVLLSCPVSGGHLSTEGRHATTLSNLPRYSPASRETCPESIPHASNRNATCRKTYELGRNRGGWMVTVGPGRAMQDPMMLRTCHWTLLFGDFGFTSQAHKDLCSVWCLYLWAVLIKSVVTECILLPAVRALHLPKPPARVAVARVV